MGIHVEFILFHKFKLKISWVKGGSGPQTGGTPPEPIWRRWVTWRIMLRTIIYYPPTCCRCVLNSPSGRFTFLKWFPLRSPRTYFVSHCKTRCSRAEVLLSGTLRGGGGCWFPCPSEFSLDKTSTFCACSTPRQLQKRALLVPRRSIWHKSNWPQATSQRISLISFGKVYLCSKMAYQFL